MARPTIRPTEEQHKLVRTLAACGVPQEHIRRHLGIRSLKTLRKHYREELDGGAADANFSVARTLFKMATSGMNLRATTFWLATRAGWKTHSAYQSQQASPPAFIVARDDGGHKP
jgi:hypothetical protein